jgi:threonyl-tRNA synthetase
MTELDEPYKVERILELGDDAELSIYRQGEYVDLCQGPHLHTTGLVKAFKLTQCTGAYYKGDQNNKMLQRIYGIVAKDQAELDEILAREEEARKRDHRILGRQLELFTITESVGPGLAHWLPKGSRVRVAIEEYWRKKHYEAGYEIIYTPHVGRSNLWQTSGHLGFYKEGMFPCMKVKEGSGEEAYEEEYYVKPMNCPFHIQVYQAKKRSYRDLPMRLAELGTVYRYEKDGVRAEGLIGPEDTRCFSMDRFILNDATLTLTQPASIWICAEGQGTVTAPEYSRELKQGDYFFLPAGAAGDCRVSGSMTLICCMGGE